MPRRQENSTPDTRTNTLSVNPPTRPPLEGYHYGQDPRIEIPNGFVPISAPIRFSGRSFQRSGSIS